MALHNMKNNKQQKGFTLLYAVLVSSIVLAASLSIINIALKQHKLSALSRESQVAFYAANTGVDCALYWDVKGRDTEPDVTGVFLATGTYDDPRIDGDDDPLRTDSDPMSINCLGEDIVQSEEFYKDSGDPINQFYSFPDESGDYHWDERITFGSADDLEDYCLTRDNIGDYRTWIFQVILPDSSDTYSKNNSCAVVGVCKNTNFPANGGYNTVYTARGYNTCDITKENVVERGVVLIQN